MSNWNCESKLISFRLSIRSRVVLEKLINCGCKQLSPKYNEKNSDEEQIVSVQGTDIPDPYDEHDN